MIYSRFFTCVLRVSRDLKYYMTSQTDDVTSRFSVHVSCYCLIGFVSTEHRFEVICISHWQITDFGRYGVCETGNNVTV